MPGYPCQCRAHRAAAFPCRRLAAKIAPTGRRHVDGKGAGPAVNRKVGVVVYNCLERLLNGLYPPLCILCGAGLAGEIDFCAGCHADLPWLGHSCPGCASPLVAAGTAVHCGRCQRRPPPFERAVAALRYEFPADRLVQSFKFEGRLSYGASLGRLLAECIAAGSEELPECLVPVPLHPARLAERGYNQAQELSRAVAKRLRMPIAAGLARRRRPTAMQTGLDAAARRRNVRDAFEIRGRPPRSVAIVDDVLTTASTVGELARALRAAGAARIEVWALARAHHPSQ